MVLTFDIGTQSMRGFLVNARGDFLASCQKKYETPYYSKHEGWAEQKPDFYYEALCEVGKKLREENEELFGDIFAVTVTSIRDTALCLDKDNKPVSDIILWLDKREAENPKPFKFSKVLIFKLVKMLDSTLMLYRASVCNWIMENAPDLWARTAKFVMLPTYINYKLTGNLRDSAANMIGHIPFDYKNRRWMGKNGLTRCVCDVPEEKLCELVASGETVGYITEETEKRSGIPAGLPLIATGSDKGCETLGLSVITKNKAAISLGTTATVQFMTRDYFEPQQFMPAYPAVPNDMYNPEIQIYRGYWMLSWFKSEFAEKECEQAKKLGCSAESILNVRLKEVPAGCDGLVLQPYWTPGITIPAAKGAVIGFSDVHTKMHLYRAIIEGVGFALMHGLYTMEKRSGVKITELYIGGGGAQSDEICQITADMFGLPVKRIQTHESCGLGSSMVAFVANKTYGSYEEAVEGMVRVKDVFMPDSKNHEMYKKIYNEVYTDMYRRLEPLYRRIRKIMRSESK